MQALAEWENFYLIVGGASGALIGLQFVVMTLIAEHPPKGITGAGSAFATPTIIHFSAVLLVSALLNMPVHTITILAFIWGLMGVGGVLYLLYVTRIMRQQTVYQPELVDYLFYIALPVIAYLTLAVLALFALYRLNDVLFGIAAAALILLFTGIHNAWDSIAYHVFMNIRNEHSEWEG
jgi:hypothetical protein